MALLNKLPLPDIYVSEYLQYKTLAEKFNRSTTGNLTFTSTSSGIVYNTSAGLFPNTGEQGLGNMLYDVLKSYIFANTDYDLMKTAITDLETDVGTAQTDITNLETDVEIINTAVSDTGTVNNIVIATAGTFDMAKNGNVTPFIIPLFTNTGSATLSIDGGTVTGIRKANDAGTLVVLEAGDIKKNVPTQFVLDTVSGFFVYAPKGGGEKFDRPTIIYGGLPDSVAVTSRLSVAGSGWVFGILNHSTVVAYSRLDIDGVKKFPSSNNSIGLIAGRSIGFMIRFETGFQFYDDANLCAVYYCLGDDLKKAMPKAYYPTAINQDPVTLRSTVSGKGYLTFIGSPSNSVNAIRLELDGVLLGVVPLGTGFGYRINGGISTLLRFESELKIYTDVVDDPIVTYILD